MTIEDRQERGRKLLDEMLGEQQAADTLKQWQQISPEFGEYVCYKAKKVSCIFRFWSLLCSATFDR